MLVKTEGIVIRRQNYGETNVIITVYSIDFGKISMMARGAKKPKSRLSSVCQLFTCGNYLFRRHSASSMGTLTQGEIIHSFRHLRQDLTMTAYAAYFAELVDRLINRDERSARLFQWLLLTFQYLNEGKDAAILARIFELKILSLAGYRPQLNQCVHCARKEGQFGFSIKEGGLLCQRCQWIDPERLNLPLPSLKLLRLLFHLDLKRLGDINVRPDTKDDLQNTMWAFMDHHTPLRLKSRSFLEDMENFLD